MSRAHTPGGALVERDAELSRIADRLRRAREGEGALVVVEGPAGIGKTSLLHALRDEASRTGMHVLHARGAELEREFAFGVLRAALAPTLASLDPHARASATAGQAAHALAMLEPGRDPGEPEAILHGLYWLLVNLAEQAPVALVVDDAQWADPASIDALAFLARRIDDLPVAVVVATRPPDVDARPALAALAAHRGAEVLRPAPLGTAGIAELAGTDDPGFLSAASEATGGNPFLLDQLLRELGTNRTSEAVASVEPRDLAQAVLAGLSENARALARAMVVLGDSAGLRECAALATLETAEAAAAELRLAGVADEDGLRFRHPLLAAAVETELGEVRRSAWHERAVTLLAAADASDERLALHLTKAEPAGDPERARVLRRAATAAAARGAPVAAVGLLRRALGEPPATEDRLGIAFDLGRVLSLEGDPEASEILLEVGRATDDPVMRAEALVARGFVSGSFGAGEQVAELTAAIDDLPPDAGALRMRLDSLRMEQSAAAWEDPTALGELLDRADALGLFEDAADVTPDLLANLARWKSLNGDPADACAAVAERAAVLAIDTTGGLPNGLWFPITVMMLSRAERLDRSMTIIDRAEQAASERGSPFLFAHTRAHRAWNQRERGLLIDAEADAAAAVDAAEVAGVSAWVRAITYSGLIEVLVDRGDLDEAGIALERLGLEETVPAARAFIPVLFARGALRHELGELDCALRDLEEADRRICQYGPPSMTGQDGRLRRALILRERGDMEGAQQLCQQAMGIANRWGTPGAIGGALRVRGVVEGDLETLRSAVEHLVRSPLRLELARAQADLGAALRRANARAEARGPLREALEIAREGGADALSAKIEEELEATGVRVPPRPGGGAASLTPQEGRIARMAADGLSNKEIAQALFVTVKTVEMHLGNAYRKLDINSRRELETVLAG